MNKYWNKIMTMIISGSTLVTRVVFIKSGSTNCNTDIVPTNENPVCCQLSPFKFDVTSITLPCIVIVIALKMKLNLFVHLFYYIQYYVLSLFQYVLQMILQSYYKLSQREESQCNHISYPGTNKLTYIITYI